MYITSSSLRMEIMTKNKHRRKRPEQPLDLALVIGLSEMIKRLARHTSLGLKFAELAVIEKYEQGARRRAIKHIRQNATPQQLGLLVADPQPKGPNPGALIAKRFRAGQPCPECHQGKLCDKKLKGGKLTVCSNKRCEFECEHVTLKFDPEITKAVTKFLTNLRNHRILGCWYGLNDPDPPRY